jgi:maleylacetoacetate isomerase
MKLFSYFRSTAAYRVRIALGLKGVDHEIVAVNLAAGEQRSEAFLKRNPQGLVPALQLDCGSVIAQSGAILEWLEESYPEPALYGPTALARAGQRALCQHIACDIHPLNNLRVLRYLENELERTSEQRSQWYAHWIQQGFVAIEDAVAKQSGPFSLGETPGMFEVFLIPQLFNARRFNVNIDAFPLLQALDERCQARKAFADAHPLNQPDTPEELRA